jgi:hypothetical protein
MGTLIVAACCFTAALTLGAFFLEIEADGSYKTTLQWIARLGSLTILGMVFFVYIPFLLSLLSVSDPTSLLQPSDVGRCSGQHVCS